MKRTYLILTVLILASVVALPIVAQKKKGHTANKQTTTKTMNSKKQTDVKPIEAGKDAIVEITTSLGDIKVKLYGDTPKHQANFLKLASEGYYNGVLFHRVIKDFMVQTGDPNSKNATPGAQLGTGDPGYTLEAEILYPKHYHKYGALAAARTGDQVNPERRSSGSQFYIVTGEKQSERAVNAIAQRMEDNVKQNYWMQLQKENIDEIRRLQAADDRDGLENLRQRLIERLEKEVKVPEMPQQMKDDYMTVGGTPHLDGQYTVFGEVIDGMDVVEKIQNASTDKSDRPQEDIRIISMKVLQN